MNLSEDRTEVLLPGTNCTVVVFTIEYIEHNSFARGNVSVTFEDVKRVINNPWVANLKKDQWVVFRPQDGRSNFFDSVTFQPAFTPYKDANDGIMQFIAEKLKDYSESHLVETIPLPHQAAVHVPFSEIGCPS